MQNDWMLVYKNIIHRGCRNGNLQFQDLPVWYPRDEGQYGSAKEFLWCCIDCHEKAPDHFIIQWKLLND